MAYLNPFHIFDLSPNDPDSARERYARNKVFAEFELENAVQVEIKGILMDKSTVLRLWDELHDPSLRKMHASIFENKPLRIFLEKGGKAPIPRDFGPLEDPQYLELVGKALPETLGKAVIAQAKLKQEKQVRLLGKAIQKLPHSLRLKALDRVGKFVRAQTAQFEEYIQLIRSLAFEKGFLDEFTTPARAEMLNMLTGIFEGDRIKYIDRLISLCDGLENRSLVHIDDLIKALSALGRFPLNENQRFRVKYRLDNLKLKQKLADVESAFSNSAYNSAQSNSTFSPPETETKKSNFAVFAPVALVLGILILLIITGRSRSSYTSIKIPDISKFNIPRNPIKLPSIPPPSLKSYQPGINQAKLDSILKSALGEKGSLFDSIRKASRTSTQTQADLISKEFLEQMRARNKQILDSLIQAQRNTSFLDSVRKREAYINRARSLGITTPDLNDSINGTNTGNTEEIPPSPIPEKIDSVYPEIKIIHIDSTNK